MRTLRFALAGFFLSTFVFLALPASAQTDPTSELATTTLSGTAATLTSTVQAAYNTATKIAVQIDTLKPSGGAIKAAADFVQGVTSRTSPVTNPYNGAGRAFKIGLRVREKAFLGRVWSLDTLRNVPHVRGL